MAYRKEISKDLCLEMYLEESREPKVRIKKRSLTLRNILL